MSVPLKFKLKQVPTDVWSVREKLCLASSVMRSGDQNWVSVSRAIKVFGEPNRPADWFSQKNCALQYSDLLEKVETPKRKRGEREIETPGESIVKKLTQERIEELIKKTEESRKKYKRLKLQHDHVRSGVLDGDLETVWQQILLEKKQEKEEEEKYQKWLLDREAERQAAIASMKSSKIPVIPIAKQKRGFKQNKNTRRSSTQSEQGSESESIANSPMEENIKTEPMSVEETSTSSSVPEETTKASPLPPTSPLLTSLLKNPSPATTHPGYVPLQTIASQKEEPAEKPNAPSTSSLPAAKTNDENPTKSTYISPSAGAPTLSRLLELPWTSPGKPLPALPIVTPVVNTDESVIETVETKEEKPQIEKSPVPSVEATEVKIEEEEVVTKEPEAIIDDVDKEEEVMSEPIEVEEQLAVTTTEKDEVHEEAPKVDEEVPVVEEVISYPEEQEVQINVEIQEEHEVEIEIQEEVTEVQETVVTEEVKIEEVVEVEVEKKPEVVEEEKVPSPPPPKEEEEEKPVAVEEKVVESSEAPQPTKTEGSKGSRGKRDRGPRKNTSTRSVSQSTANEDEVTTETVPNTSETTEKESKEKAAEKKTSEEKAKGRKPKRKRETKESSDEESNETTKKRRQSKRQEKKKTEVVKKRPSRSSKVKDESSPSSDEEEKQSEVKEETVIKLEVPSDSIPNSPSSLSHSDDPDSLRDYKLWKKAIMLVWRSAANHKYANVFLHPVTDDVAPGYSSVVFRPMDLSQIKKGIESGAIKTTSDFQRDMMLMFQNAIMYNSSDHDVFHMAVEMQKEVETHIQDFRATQLMVQTTEAPKNLRRETRELSHKRTTGSDYRDRADDYKRNTPEADSSKFKKRRTRAAEHDSSLK